MRKLIGLVGLAAAALLTACGGGGGSPGDTSEGYSITLTAAKSNLPINVGHYPVGIGAHAPFTTTLHVNGKKGSSDITPGGDEDFYCNIEEGLNSGSLYYLDGDEDHEDDDGNPLPYRNITLGAIAGGNSFHFHAGDQAGVAKITCAVRDRRTETRLVSKSVNITIGGGAGTGRVASVYAIAQSGYLGSQSNLNNIPASVGINAFVMDDAVQPITNPSAANVKIRIVPNTVAANGARLLLGDQSGQIVQATTQGGVALFSLSSGPSRGAILLELTADRYDNDVTNGIQDPVLQWAAIPVVDGVSLTPLAFAGAEVDMPNGEPFATALEASGGTPPYQWSVVSGVLPTGLSLSTDGVLRGTPLTTPGIYVIRVRVTDIYGDFEEAPITIKISGEPIEVDSASISANTGVPFSYALSASGGVAPYTWSAVGTMPPGLTLNSNGVVSGTPTLAGTYSVAIRVTDARGASVLANLTINVGVPLAISTTTISVTTGIPFNYALQAVGGVSPYTWARLDLDPEEVIPNGILTGTYSAAGSYIIPIRVTDAAGRTLIGNVTVEVKDPS